jgi:hypothetical protein
LDARSFPFLQRDFVEAYQRYDHQTGKLRLDLPIAAWPRLRD